MVMKANKNYGGLGGHIASYASFAEVFETGFNHFFKGGDEADLIFYQSQCTTGIYARSFLEGRLTKNHLEHYRQELNDWLDSLDAVVENHGREGAKLILEKLEKRAKDLRVLYSPVPY